MCLAEVYLGMRGHINTSWQLHSVRSKPNIYLLPRQVFSVNVQCDIDQKYNVKMVFV